ncbi:hypothetical protein [Acinetobacter nematophilus]|uniref:Uncharacterized protein n=1 Tax=Acinetobacter nematophilus TaxID=2994642 RepID=A0A9X3DRL7_9GAMM|nr:hypothetical protein [Acinetobacter nematophilus]MCX5467173.1 hypothetical protein [Acinetobacter nematophilus]
MDSLKDKIQENFITYQNEIFKNLSIFIRSIELEHEFNFTYINLYLLLTQYEEDFYSHLKKVSHDYWFFDDFNNRPPDGILGDLGLKINELNDLEKESSLKFTSMYKVWLDRIGVGYSEFLHLNNFDLIKNEFDLKLIKGKKNKEIALAYSGIFNTQGWMFFLNAIFKSELQNFKAEFDDNEFYVFKVVGDYIIKIEINPDNILNINELLKNYGVFYFGIILTINLLKDKSKKIYPPELSFLLTDSLFKKYSIKFKNASCEEAKIRVYANVKAYCQLINILLPTLEKLLTGNNLN